MAPRIPRSETEVDARSLRMHFSEGVQEYFHDLVEIARKSSLFDPETTATLEDWGSGKAASVHDVMISMPLIAEQMADHVSKTQDQDARDIWRGLCIQLAEEGFKISQSLRKTR